MEDNKAPLVDGARAFSVSAIAANTDSTDFDPQPQLVTPTETASPSSSSKANSTPDSPAEASTDTESADMTLISTKQTKSFPWERCPVEIREMIFDEVKNRPYPSPYWEWNGSIPALVVALRGLKKSYKQVLQRFKKENRGHLRMDAYSTDFDIGDMTELELETFKEATLILQ